MSEQIIAKLCYHVVGTVKFYGDAFELISLV